MHKIISYTYNKVLIIRKKNLHYFAGPNSRPHKFYINIWDYLNLLDFSLLLLFIRHLDILIRGQMNKKKAGLMIMWKKLKFLALLVSVANEIRHMINVRKRNLTLHNRKYQNLFLLAAVPKLKI